ncbi:hypothetical protein MKX01_027086, partial [Papaver californicum]
KKYQGKLSLSATNSTKIYFNMDLPEVMDMRQSNCTTKLVGEDGDQWCTKCEPKIDEPTPRFMLRFEVQDPTSSTFFVALDSEVQKIVQTAKSDIIMLREAEGKAWVVASFDGLLGVEKDYQITITSFNTKWKTSSIFTVSKLPHKPGDQV